MKAPKYLITATRPWNKEDDVCLIEYLLTDEELLSRLNKLSSSGHETQVYKLTLLDNVDLQDINNDLERNDPDAYERVCSGA